MDKIAILKEILEHLISHQGMGLKSALDESKKPKEIDIEVMSPVKEEGSYDDKVDQAIKDSHVEEEKPEGEMTDEELEELLQQHGKKKSG